MPKTELTKRQKMVMGLIVKEFIRTAQPIASNHLLNEYSLDLSSATVRNEMSALVKIGYIRKSHKMGGSIPTEEGYRFFVGQLLGETELPELTRQSITQQFSATRPETDDWMRKAAAVLATESQGASLVTAPQHINAQFKHLELISLRGRQILLVLVMTSGEVHQQMLVLTEVVEQEALSATANVITSLCGNKDISAVSALSNQNDALTDDIIRMVKDLMREASSDISTDVYRDGLLNVLTQPEFADSKHARQALRVFEERPLLENLLSQTVLNSDVGVVQVIIGGEGNWDELSDCSMVLARYGVNGTATGTVGVLGPTRMRYGRNISTVQFVAGLLSNMVIESHELPNHDEKFEEE